MIAMLVRHREENGKLRLWLEAMTKKLREVKDRFMGETAKMARLAARERVEQDKVEERLGRMLADVGVQIDLLRGVYRRASVMMPAIGLDPYHHRADFDDRRLADLIPFFQHLSEQLTASARC